MKPEKQKNLSHVLLPLTAGLLLAGAARAEEAASVTPSAVDPTVRSASVAPSKAIRFSRINVMAGGFVELDLEIMELKAQPYVEFRFNRRK